VIQQNLDERSSSLTPPSDRPLTDSEKILALSIVLVGIFALGMGFFLLGST